MDEEYTRKFCKKFFFSALSAKYGSRSTLDFSDKFIALEIYA
jgi:hypothetical protein